MRFLDRLGRLRGCLVLFGLLGAAFAILLGAHSAFAQQPNAQPRVQKPHARQAHAEQPHGPRAHVYLLRGLFNVFSLGMDSLAEELNRRGVETTVDNYADWTGLANQAAARYKAGTENPIILIGHSLGADAVMDMAAYLGRKDVPVALVIPFDGTKPLIAPSNVGRVVNLTQRSYAYARPGAGFHGSLANVDVSFDKNIDHITIDKAPRTHARAISEVMAVVGHAIAAPKEQQAPEAEKPAAAPAAHESEPEPEHANENNAAPSPAAPTKPPAVQN
jgi:pimeloyl-ACP methyl ester carboxylesterase